jgi:hypothetical protein
MPDFVSALPEPFARALRPTRSTSTPSAERWFAVLGAGASALDNAAVALGHGCIRGPPVLPANHASAGAALSLAHVRGLPATPVGPGRCLALALHEHRSSGCAKGSPRRPGTACAQHCELPSAHRLALAGAHKPSAAASSCRRRTGRSAPTTLICGTGVDMDFSRRPELNRFGGKHRNLGRSLHTAAGAARRPPGAVSPTSAANTN